MCFYEHRSVIITHDIKCKKSHAVYHCGCYYRVQQGARNKISGGPDRKIIHLPGGNINDPYLGNTFLLIPPFDFLVLVSDP